MSDLKSKVTQKIDDAAEGAKKMTGKLVDQSKDIAHAAGKKIEQGGKKLRAV